MTDEPRQTTPRPILTSISAQLFVANIKSSSDFYTNKLDFAVEFVYGDPPYYGQLFRHGLASRCAADGWRSTADHLVRSVAAYSEEMLMGCFPGRDSHLFDGLSSAIEH